MAAPFAVHDVVVFDLPGHDPSRTWEVTELDPHPDARELAPLVRIWPTDPNDVRVGQWVGGNLLKLAEQCPQHCPRCGVDLKAEGYPLGHKTDEGDQCEWHWDPPEPTDAPANIRACAGGCGLAADAGDVYCPGCREGHERDRTYGDPDRLGGH